MGDISPTTIPFEYSVEQDTFLNNYSSDDTENELLIVTVDIRDDYKEQLVIHEGDNLENLADAFCDKNDLGPKARQVLIEEIEKHLQSLYSHSLSRNPESSQQIASIENSIKIEKHNKGQEMYNRGVKMRKKTENKYETIIKEREDKEMKHTTFRPLTNSPDKRSRPPEQILLEKGRKTVEMLQKKRSERDMKLLSHCTFAPEVNKNSANMKRNQSRSPNRYESLYQDAQNIQEKIVRKSIELYFLFRIHEKCPFEPNFALTRKKTKQLTKKMSNSSNAQRKDCFSYPTSPEVRNIQKAYVYSPPKIQEHCPHATENSEKIIKRLKNIKYKEIFDDLLPDTKGFINKETVYKSVLQTEIKEIIKPLLEELECYDEFLNYEDFYDAMEMLMRSITPAEKNLILQTSKKKSNIEDPKSKKKIATKRNSVSPSIFQKPSTEVNHKVSL